MSAKFTTVNYIDLIKYYDVSVEWYEEGGVDTCPRVRISKKGLEGEVTLSIYDIKDLYESLGEYYEQD